MARLFGFISNRRELGARVLSAHSEWLRVTTEPGQPLGWGVGFHQFGEVLLRRRPLDERQVLNLAEVTRDIETDVLIGHVRTPTVGNLRTENTHPFRYGQWLLAQTGTIAGFAAIRERLRESQPEFLRRSVRGDTDAESFFYLFLSFLHDAGALSSPTSRPAEVRSALRSAVALVDRLCAEEGNPPGSGDILVADGECMVAVHRSGKMGFLTVDDANDVKHYLRATESEAARLDNLDKARLCLIATELPELPPGWRRPEQSALVTAYRAAPPETEAL